MILDSVHAFLNELDNSRGFTLTLPVSLSNEGYIEILIDYLRFYIFFHIYYAYSSCRMLNTVINSLPGSSFCRFAYFLFKLPADLYFNCLFILSSIHFITVCVQVCTGHMCHGACVKWQLHEGLLFFTLFWVLGLKPRLSGWQGYHLYLLSHLANPQCFYSQMSYLVTFKNSILWYYFQFSYYRQLFAYFSLLNNSSIPDL